MRFAAAARQLTPAWPPLPPRLSQALALRDFLLPMLNFEPSKRATAAEMLQHHWLAQ